MPTVQTPGDGSLLKVTISASPTAIAKQTKFGPVKRKRASIDFTGLADVVETFVAGGIKRSDEVAFTGWYDATDATHAYLETSYAGGLTEVWTILFANAHATTIVFSGFLTELEIGEVNIDGLVPIAGSIRPTTAFTVTP